jgi:hypothetical protein
MMSLKSRRELLAVVAPRYRTASAEERSHILDEFVASTGYHRKYALSLLNHPLSNAAPPKKRHRQRRYPFAVQQALIRCWRASNGICSKRLIPYLPELVSVLERVGELHLDEATKAQLLTLSPATADRFLQAERHRSPLRGLSTTKPGTLLTDAVPIRTFADWDEVHPGFTEIDLVAHCGSTAKGDYLYTLTGTDIRTGWTECLAVRNRGQLAVFQAIIRFRARLPFPLRGLDSDNGVEFLNTHLVTYCQQEQLTFTRSRPFKKNDQAYVEQKNWSIVRHLVGYARYEGQPAWDALQNLYDVVRLYTNFFQPSMKLVSKQRTGAKVKKTYDAATTPYQRVLADDQVALDVKERLTQEYLTLNPLALLRQMHRLQAALWELALSEAAVPAVLQAAP